MNAEERAQFADLLDGLYAYESGSADSGIHDPIRREKAAETVARLTETERMDIAQRLYGQAPYTDEDVDGFVGWLNDLAPVPRESKG